MKNEEQIIASPLTSGLSQKIAEFDVLDVEKSYMNLYDIDVKGVFKDLKKIKLYKCLDSDYEFYYPLNLAGADSFYKKLSTYKWYYIPWKWEHQKSMQFVEKSKSILEVGCGEGSFLKVINQKFPNKSITGLEITVGTNKENFILNQTIEEYAIKNEDQHGLVCFYQVLEHIAQPQSFLEAAIKTLKPGGDLIISVPNNDTIFLRTKGESYLNLPPHHMGLWNKKSLQYLTKQFPLKISNEFYEPIQDYHFEWFKEILKKIIRRKNIPLSYRITSSNRFMNILGNLLRPFFKGHSIMFVYKKL